MNVTKLTPFCNYENQSDTGENKVGCKETEGKGSEREEGRYKINRGKEGRREGKESKGRGVRR